MTRHPFVIPPFTWRERWSMLRAKVIVNLCWRGMHTRYCGCVAPITPVIVRLILDAIEADTVDPDAICAALGLTKETEHRNQYAAANGATPDVWVRYVTDWRALDA